MILPSPLDILLILLWVLVVVLTSQRGLLGFIVALAGTVLLKPLQLLTVYSPPLALVGLLLCAVGGLGLFLTRRAGSKYWTAMLAGGREISAEALQYFTGIVKIRTSGAERRVFARWAQHYAQQNVRALTTFRIDNARVVFQASFRTCALLVVFVALFPVSSMIGRVGQVMQVMGLAIAFTGVAIAAVNQVHEQIAVREPSY